MFHAGFAKSLIEVTPKGYAMHGWGAWHNRATESSMPLYVRTIVLADDAGGELYFCCADLGYITYAMREQAIVKLHKAWQDAGFQNAFNPQAFTLTCTHTHSGPGGCAYEGLYNVVTPGYVPEHVAAIAEAIASSILQAKLTLKPTKLTLGKSTFADDIEVAWNRSLNAYNQNPEVTKQPDTHTHLAIDRAMNVLALHQEGELVSLLSLFGVHATCVSNKHNCYDGDNKGRAAANIEKLFSEQGVADPVAIFAQATAGDVSPYYQGPNDKAKRKQIKTDAEFGYAQQNADKQSLQAQQTIEQNEASLELAGNLDSILTYVDFTTLTADPAYANGEKNAITSEPCHGVPFFEGTRIDGPGMSPILGSGAKVLASRVKAKRLNNLTKFDPSERTYYERIYHAQGVKDILMESGTTHKRSLGHALDSIPLPNFADPMLAEIKRQAKMGALDDSPMVPTVLPLQILRIGQIAIVCCPGEFTTVAGARVKAVVAEKLAGSGVEQVLICSYSNEYMGYVTTFEEYQMQRYEGGHTIFGQWTLAAFQTQFARLSDEFCKSKPDRQHDTTTRPDPVPEDELAKRSNLTPPKKW